MMGIGNFILDYVPISKGNGFLAVREVMILKRWLFSSVFKIALFSPSR